MKARILCLSLSLSFIYTFSIICKQAMIASKQILRVICRLQKEVNACKHFLFLIFSAPGGKPWPVANRIDQD